MNGLKNRRNEERIDVLRSIRPMSYNVPGNEERIKEHCERVQREYFDKGLNHAGRPKKD